VSDLGVAWANLKASVWKDIEPPLRWLVERLNRLVSR
jgi:hypothetical protein